MPAMAVVGSDPKPGNRYTVQVFYIGGRNHSTELSLLSPGVGISRKLEVGLRSGNLTQVL